MDHLPTNTVKVGKYNVDVIQNDLYIKNTLMRGYEWDGWMRTDLPRIYKSGTDIIDIGGNIGFNALMYSDYGPVHTFEPLFHSIITKNVHQNTLNNLVTVHPYGLSNILQTCTIYMNRPDQNGSINYGGCSLRLDDEKEACSIIDLKRLDDVYTGIPSIIKIDVETHEFEVIQGAANIIKTYKPSMYIEIFDFETSPIIPFLKDIGYKTILPRPEHNYLFIF